MSCTLQAGSCSISSGVRASSAPERCSAKRLPSIRNSQWLIRVSPTVAPICILYWEPTVDNLRTADSASRRAISLSPELAEAQTSRAVALSTLRNYPEAEQAFRIAIEIDPALFDAHYFYGRACLAQGKFREALAPLRSACTLRPEDYQAPALLALAYTGLRRRKLAARAYERTVEVAKRSWR